MKITRLQYFCFVLNGIRRGQSRDHQSEEETELLTFSQLSSEEKTENTEAASEMCI